MTSGRFIYVLAVLLVLCPAVSCTRGDGFDKSDLDLDEVCLKVKGNVQFSFDPYSCQISFNRGRRQFRAGTDTMSDYFKLDMSSLPSETDQTLVASISWTTSDDVASMSGLSFKVEKIGGDGMVWLWCAEQRITVVMRLL